MKKQQLRRISTLSPGEIGRRIADSNTCSASSRAKYVYWETCAISHDYDVIACPCPDECWCKCSTCNGHHRIKKIAFERFLETYLTLWIPLTSRARVRAAVLEGRPFQGRQKGAVEPLRRLSANWYGVLQAVREYDKCGLCDTGVPSAVPLVPGRTTNLYEAKLWSQFYYDSIVPFDTASKAKMKRAGYSDPARDFLAMNKELFGDLRKLSDTHGLGVLGLRRLDRPSVVDPKLKEPPNGQPLSRVIDKIFYQPKSASQAAEAADLQG